MGHRLTDAGLKAVPLGGDQRQSLIINRDRRLAEWSIRRFWLSRESVGLDHVSRLGVGASVCGSGLPRVTAST